MQAGSGKINDENGKPQIRANISRLLHLEANISPTNEANFDVFILTDSLGSWPFTNISFVKIDQEFEDNAAFKSRHL